MKSLLAVAIFFSCCAAATAQTHLLLADGNLDDWQEQGFDNVSEHSQYSILRDEELGKEVLLIESRQSASGYIRSVDLPLRADSIVNITWRVDAASNPADEKSKPGDDFPLRIYFSDSTSIGADTLTLVHSIQSESGSLWTSPYSGMLAEFKLYAFGGSDTRLGAWHTASIPIGKIWSEAFGSLPERIVLVGLMGDSDNAGGSSRARLAELELISN